MSHIPTAAELLATHGEPSPTNDLAGLASDARAQHKAALDAIVAQPTPPPSQVRAGEAHLRHVHDLDALIERSDNAIRRDYAAEAARVAANTARSERADAAAGILRNESEALTRKVRHMPTTITREARTYTREADARGAINGGHSFFADLYRSEFLSDFDARHRLEQHMKEARAEGEISERAVATSGFAGLVPPNYLVELAALAARAGRPFANSCTRLPLPDEGMSLIVPRGTTGASAAAQATENTAVSSTDEVWTNLTVPVNTVAGQQDVSRQALERGAPGIDALVYRDLSGAVAAEIDRQILVGTGAGNQALGLLNTSGIYQATAFGAAATATTFWSKLAGAVNSIEAAGTVVAPASLIVMHPRRWNWLLLQVDTAGRPLVTPSAPGITSFNQLGADLAPGAYSGDTQGGTGTDLSNFTIKGTLQGLPVITDANVPTSQGTGPEDVVWVVNTEHCLLWEQNGGAPSQLRFEQTLGNQLTTKLVSYSYFAFTASRYPLAVSQIGGNATVGNGLVSVAF